jgi:hypothetical protein
MKNLLLAVMVVFLAACAGPKGDNGSDGRDGEPGPTGPSAPIPTPTPPPVVDEIQEEIDELISYKNEERSMTAQAPLTNGLACVVQQIASGQCLSASSTAAGCNSGNVVVMTGTSYSYLYKGSFNKPDATSANPDTLLPPALRPLFLGKNYRISCSGFIVVLESDYYEFSLNSDDGSILTVNGGQVVNNDNNHGMTLKVGTALLYRNVQSFSLQYAQTGGGNHGLVLQAGGQLIDPKYFYH